MKEEYYFPSADDITQIHVCVWKPEGKPKAILQILHGMKEYIERYEEFAEYLCGKGFLVVGNDHLGHGKSVADEDSYGFFSSRRGPDDVLADVHTVREKTQEREPDVPYFMLGHSMGSALLRCYLTEKSEGLKGAIVMGAFTAPPVAVAAAKAICRVNAKLRGRRHVSKLVDSLAAGGYNKEFKDPKTPNDWLTRDDAVNEAYARDPYCRHPFTVNAYYGMFEALARAEKTQNMEKINKELPILVVSGAEDPVGHHGKDIPKIVRWYREVGIGKVNYNLYAKARHEILNDLGKETVFDDLYNWLNELIK